MNKLGFYTKNFAAPGVIEAIKTIKPKVLLTELDDFSVLQHIRNEWSPDTFVIGRFFFEHGQQGAMLDDPDPVAVGIRLAEKVLTHNFSFAKQRDENGRLYIDAWMSLNEVVRGPASFPPQAQWRDEDHQNWAKMERQAAAYDTIQAAFLDRLKQEGLEAVAFNFAAGNWIKGEDYLQYFPQTLARYTYLGFHEYGWPHMNPQEPGARSGCGIYRRVMETIRQQYGDRHRAIITEAGLARMYMHSDGGDVGWLYPDDPVAEASYKSSLRWYNGLLCGDPYTVGACLFQVGPGSDWETFRHTGLDNQDQPLTMMVELAAMTQEPAPAVAVAAAADTAVVTAPEPDLHSTLWAVGRPLIIPFDRDARLYQMAQERNLGERLTPEYEVLHDDQNYAAQIYEGGLVYAPVGQWEQAEVLFPSRDLAESVPPVFWDHHIIGFHGNRWMYWEQYVKDNLPGLTLQAFVAEVLLHNPEITADANMIKRDKVYCMPRRPDQTPAPADQPAFTPDKTQTSLIAATAVAGAAPGEVIAAAPPPDFVQVIGGRFYLKGMPSRFIGVNIRGLVHYGHDPVYFALAPKAHQVQQLQKAVEMNARLVRVFLAYKDASPEQIEVRLREVLALVKQNFPSIYLLPALTNLYKDVPFYVRGDEDFYNLTAGNHTILNPDFFREGFEQNYLPFVKHIVTAFKNEANIFAWEIGNELKAEQEPGLLVDFMKTVSTAIKGWDSNHLVTTGMISTRHAWMGDKPTLRRDLYGHPGLDFITIHAYNGNEEEVEDDSDLAQEFTKPFIIEEAGFDVEKEKYRGQRPEKTRADMAGWFGKGASCYMPWGFVATDQDNNDGDLNIGMVGPKHSDFSQLYELHKQCGQILLESNGNLEIISQRIKDINFHPSRAVAPRAWPLLADGFDFPVGKPDGLGYYVAAGLVDQSYFNERGTWHTGEDWNGRGGGDSDLGAPVYAVANGRVVASRRYPVWGNIILLEHRLPWGQMIWSQYAHLQERYVQKGEMIHRGEQLGTIGKGDKDQFQAHLHFEIRLKELPAAKGWGQTPADRAKILQAYAHPTNFINANRPR